MHFSKPDIFLSDQGRRNCRLNFQGSAEIHGQVVQEMKSDRDDVLIL